MQLRRSRSKRNIFLVFGAILCIVVALIAIVIFNRPLPRAISNNKPRAQTSRPAPTTIRLIASGDMIAHDSINQQAKTPNGYDYSPYFSEVKPVFEKADIRFCNQEIPSASPALGSPSGYPTFNAPTEFARDINTLGCNVINTATNHANDKLQAGIDETLRVWQELPKLALAGINRSLEEQQKVHYFTVKGIKFAFLAYNYQNNNKNTAPFSVNMFDESLMRKQLQEAAQQGAYSIVSMHWGTEDSPVIDQAQEKWSQFLADNGADIVIGTGPHVIQPVKKLARQGGGETLVWYSIGNLLSTQLKIEELIGGFAVMDFEVNKSDIKLKDIGFLPTYMHYEWSASQAAAQDLLARRNIKLYLLEDASAPLGRSLFNTSVQSQTERISSLLNSYTPVQIIKKQAYGL
jgi:poly-gamma-glutamate synthesis protein (capsule biosynthesis protein)